jgi:hypothetical protein
MPLSIRPASATPSDPDIAYVWHPAFSLSSVWAQE